MYDDDLENSGLRELIEKGREQGYISYADIDDFLPEDVSDPDQLEEVISLINELGLEVLENPPAEGSDFMPAAEDPQEQPDPEGEIAIESEVGRTTDPVRLYMREMGSVDLLTREGEISIAKRIEDGARDLLSACVHYPGVVEGIIEDYKLTKKGEKRISDLIVGFMDEDEAKELQQVKAQEQTSVFENMKAHIPVDYSVVEARLPANKNLLTSDQLKELKSLINAEKSKVAIKQAKKK